MAGRAKTGRPQSEFFAGKAHTFTRADALKSLETRRRLRAEKLAAADRLEREAQIRASDPTFIAAYPNPEKALTAAKRLIELEQQLEARQQQAQQRLAKREVSAADPQPQRRLLPGESPVQGLRRMFPHIYRDLLAQVQFDESKIMDRLQQQGRQLF